MDFYGSTQHKVIRSDINNNSVIDSVIDTNTDIDSYPMPSSTTITTESYANIGGPTQTTPTLTPTTLKNIEEQFMETTIPPQPRHHPQEARFVPPLVNFSANYTTLMSNGANHHLNSDLNNNSSNNSNSNTSDMDYGSDYDSDDSSSQSRSSMQWNAFCDKSSTSANHSSQGSDANNNGYNRTAKANGKTRGTSGRKPMRNEKLTPEEEKKRQQRRERNKQAAARCRKRRMDHTNQLLMETEGLEDKKHSLLNEIEVLRKQTEELEYILEAHKVNCKMSGTKGHEMDVKPVVSNGNVVSNVVTNGGKPRPNSLPLSCIYTDHLSDTGISIQTPSAGLFLEAMECSGTGLTPILNSTLTPSLVTPTVTSSSCGVRLKASPLDSPKKLVPL